jgi:hypothetical protein
VIIDARERGGRRSVGGMEDEEALVPAHARRRGGGEERWKWARVWNRKRPSVVLYIQTKEKGDARYMLPVTYVTFSGPFALDCFQCGLSSLS